MYVPRVVTQVACRGVVGGMSERALQGSAEDAVCCTSFYQARAALYVIACGLADPDRQLLTVLAV